MDEMKIRFFGVKILTVKINDVAQEMEEFEMTEVAKFYQEFVSGLSGSAKREG